MARRTLSGVEAVTRTARNITRGSLEKRVPLKRRGDEIDQLALTFNRMLDRIEHLVTGIREMSDNIAHDLKSPVTRIRGLAEVTLTTDRTADGYERLAASTIEECDRLLDMINTMLLISRTEAGADSLARERVDLADLVRKALALFQVTAEDRGIDLVGDVAERCELYGDCRMIQRLVANLLDNAIKYTPASGQVSVALECSRNGGADAARGQHTRQTGDGRRGPSGLDDGALPGWATLSVKDTGMGISAEELPQIFERFYRCDHSRSRAGTGLGLSLARAIAVAHGGRIDVVSRPGSGSTFTVRLPVSDRPGGVP
jgi:signal transduction histidine kinase